MLWRSVLSASVMLAVLSQAGKVFATPAEIFNPYVEQIQRSLPPSWRMRLPSKILLGGPADDDFISQLKVRLFPTASPPGLTVGLFSCTNGPQPCLVGSFSVASPASPDAQREFATHQAAAAPIKLADGVRGYLLEGSARKPASIFSSVMWEQDGLLYTASFLLGERQNLLNMAHLMASDRPIMSSKRGQTGQSSRQTGDNR